MKQTPLSSPGLTGRPSIPEAFEIDRGAAAYWIARSSRAMTVLIVAAAFPSPSFFLGANGSRECAPDDRLRDEAIQLLASRRDGLLRFACNEGSFLLPQSGEAAEARQRS